MPAFSFMLAGKLNKYKPVEGIDVAKAMLNAAKSDKIGIHVYTYKEIESLAAKTV